MCALHKKLNLHTCNIIPKMYNEELYAKYRIRTKNQVCGSKKCQACELPALNGLYVCEFHARNCEVCGDGLPISAIKLDRTLCHSCKCDLCRCARTSDSRYCTHHRCKYCSNNYDCAQHRCMVCKCNAQDACAWHQCKDCDKNPQAIKYMVGGFVHSVSEEVTDIHHKYVENPLAICYSYHEERDCAGYNNAQCCKYDYKHLSGSMCGACLDINMCECGERPVAKFSTLCVYCNYEHICPICSESVYGRKYKSMICSNAHLFEACKRCGTTVDRRDLLPYNCLICCEPDSIYRVRNFINHPFAGCREDVVRRALYVKMQVRDFKKWFQLSRQIAVESDDVIDTFMLFLQVGRLPRDIFYKIVGYFCVKDVTVIT
jgi:hypothetical protein